MARLRHGETLATDGVAVVACAECGATIAEEDAQAARWAYWSDDIRDLYPCCPACALRDFEYTTRFRDRARWNPRPIEGEQHDLVSDLRRELERVRHRLDLLSRRRDPVSAELRDELEIEQRWIERRLQRADVLDSKTDD